MRKHASEMIAKHSAMVNASVGNATMWPLFAVLALVALQAVVNMTAIVWYFYSRRARHNTYVLCLHLTAPRTATLFVCALCVGQTVRMGRALSIPIFLPPPQPRRLVSSL